MFTNNFAPNRVQRRRFTAETSLPWTTTTTTNWNAVFLNHKAIVCLRTFFFFFKMFLLLTVSATHIKGAGYSTFASTYNAHTINHAVAYPAGTKASALTVFATPAINPDLVPAPTLPPSTGSTTAITLTPVAASKPVATSGAVPLHTPQVPLIASGPIAFASASLGPTGVAYPNGPIFAAGSAYTPSYSSAPAFGPAYVIAPAAFAPPASLAYPAASASPAYAIPGTGSVAFTSGSSISGPIPAASLASVFNIPIPLKVPGYNPHKLW